MNSDLYKLWYDANNWCASQDFGIQLLMILILYGSVGMLFNVWFCLGLFILDMINGYMFSTAKDPYN